MGDAVIAGAKWLFAWLGALWCLGASGQSLHLQVDHADSPLGAGINLTFTAQGLPLGTLDLSPLSREFNLGPTTTSQTNDQQTLTVTLYPLHTGTIVLPSFRLGHAQTKPLELHITSGSALVPTVDAQLSVAPANLVARQPAHLFLDICDDGSLLWHRPQLPTGDGLYQEAQGETETQATRNGTSCILHRYSWSVMPTRAGLISIHLPTLKATKFGAPLRFPAPQLQFNVQATPGWLPLAVPVGRLQVVDEPLPSRWPLHRPLAWTFSVQGGLGAEELRRLLMMQLAAHPLLATYPPVVESVPQGRDAGSGFTLRTTIYLRPDQTGLLHVPRLVFPWFDPAQGELHAETVPSQTVTVFNPLYQRIRRGIAIVAAVLAILATGWFGYRFSRGVIARRRCVKAITNAEDVAGLVRALRQCHGRAGAITPTLGAWRQHFRSRSNNERLDGLVRTLEAMHYGGQHGDLAELKQGLLKCLRGRGVLLEILYPT